MTYYIDDLVSIKRIQFRLTVKLAKKHLGPYRIVKQRRLDCFYVWEVGISEEPIKTSTKTDFMKPWCPSMSSRDKEEDAASDKDVI